MDSTNSSTTKPLYRGTQIVYAVLCLIEALLAFRFLLKLFAANEGAGFTSFIYGITYPFVLPFLSVFRNAQIASSKFEWTTLLAMLVYWLVAIAIIRVFVMGRTVSTPEAAVKLEEKDK